MYEVEVKVRADHADVRDQLEDRGASELGTVTQVDTYYDAPHRDFAETDEALRVRREQTTGVNPSAVGDAVEDEAAGDVAVDDEAVVDEAMDGEAVGDEAVDDERVELTYKGPLLEAESKSREEHETAVGDSDAIERILKNLGFDPAATVEKERDRYELQGFTVTLDGVDGLGEFVEVETETADDDISDARDGARALLESLHLDPDDQIRTSYLGLLLDSGSGDSRQ